MLRVFRVAALGLLLLFAQQAVLVHPIEHLASHDRAPKESGLSVPQAQADCVQCALLAAGSLVLPFEAVASRTIAGAFAPSLRFTQSRAAAVPSWFNSRAPPLLV